jgi:hypothetical protein
MTHAADDDAAFWDDPHGAFETKASYELAEGLSAMPTTSCYRNTTR